MLFSSISPNYDADLKEELFRCFKYIGIPFNILDKMPIRDRKFYISRHNQETEETNRKYTNQGKQTVEGESINSYANMEQQNMINAQNRR